MYLQLVYKNSFQKLPEHSRTLQNILEHFRTFQNILEKKIKKLRHYFLSLSIFYD